MRGNSVTVYPLDLRLSTGKCCLRCNTFHLNYNLIGNGTVDRKPSVDYFLPSPTTVYLHLIHSQGRGYTPIHTCLSLVWLAPRSACRLVIQFVHIYLNSYYLQLRKIDSQLSTTIETMQQYQPRILCLFGCCVRLVDGCLMNFLNDAN